MDKKLSETFFSIVFCRQLGNKKATKNSVSNYLWSMFVDRINVFHCPLSGVDTMGRSPSSNPSDSVVFLPHPLVMQHMISYL